MAQNHPPAADLSPLVETMIESYRADQRTHHVDVCYLPSRDEVIALVDQLRELMFPGYFGQQGLTWDNINQHLQQLLESIYQRLFLQIRNVLRHEQQHAGLTDCPDCDISAGAITREFLGRLPKVRQVLSTDVQAAFDGDPAAHNTDEIIFSYPGFYAISIFRLAHELWELKVPIIPRIMTEYAHGMTGIDIHPGATVGEYFFIDHGTGVVIGETTTIGRNVKVYQGVTLGATSTRGGQALRGAKRHPTIEDEVTVYPNASILGGDTIVGKGATVNGNVFLTQSVPPYTRVSVKHPEPQYRNRPARVDDLIFLDFQI
ncbi:MAG: serine acetyltransferase [Phycisphaerae bacterium]